MKIYQVVEYLIDRNYKQNAEGFYSTFKKAQQAILNRVADEYIEEEMKQFSFSDDGCVYITKGNDWTESCSYVIYENEVDEKIE